VKKIWLLVWVWLDTYYMTAWWNYGCRSCIWTVFKNDARWNSQTMCCPSSRNHCRPVKMHRQASRLLNPGLQVSGNPPEPAYLLPHPQLCTHSTILWHRCLCTMDGASAIVKIFILHYRTLCLITAAAGLHFHHFPLLSIQSNSNMHLWMHSTMWGQQ